MNEEKKTINNRNVANEKNCCETICNAQKKAGRSKKTIVNERRTSKKAFLAGSNCEYKRRKLRASNERKRRASLSATDAFSSDAIQSETPRNANFRLFFARFFFLERRGVRAGYIRASARSFFSLIRTRALNKLDRLESSTNGKNETRQEKAPNKCDSL